MPAEAVVRLKAQGCKGGAPTSGGGGERRSQLRPAAPHLEAEAVRPGLVEIPHGAGKGQWCEAAAVSRGGVGGAGRGPAERLFKGL